MLVGWLFGKISRRAWLSTAIGEAAEVPRLQTPPLVESCLLCLVQYGVLRTVRNSVLRCSILDESAAKIFPTFIIVIDVYCKLGKHLTP